MKFAVPLGVFLVLSAFLTRGCASTRIMSLRR